MAAYAALVSVMHIIDNLRLHRRPPINLHKEQAHLLTQKVTFLQQFLEVYNPNLPYSKDADPLESRIARAAYAAEDAIESRIFDQVNNNDGEKMSSDSLYQDLEKVVEDMELIEKEAMEIKVTRRFQLQAKSTTPADSSRSRSTSLSPVQKMKSRMVGADDALLQLKDKLTSNRPDLQVIPIVGMGGLGKTTLALNIYQDGLIREHFDIRALATISQEYRILEILIQLLTQLISEVDRDLSEGELGEMLYKHLYGRKYMIILDDMWSLSAWDGVRRFLPNNENGSRIIITTRLTSLGSTLSNSNIIQMKLLDQDDSWALLSKTVFGEKGCCPSRFEEIGKKIGQSCRGLPLSIVVVGGLLAMSEHSIESWEHMEGNLNAIVNLDDDERSLKTLYMSYKQLPVHLKPCFLYMGIYREDYEICTSKLVKVWVAEGFLKPMSGKNLEDVARVYLKELIDRNLILIHELGSIGSIKKCKVHDLLRDLCLREAQKEGFYSVCPGQEIEDSVKIEDSVSRIVISGGIPEEIHALSSSAAPLARSLILDLDDHVEQGVPLGHLLRLLRIAGSSIESDSNMRQLVNSRSLEFMIGDMGPLSSILLFWNIKTLIVQYFNDEIITVPTDIWHMSHIRHICFHNLFLPDPPPSAQANGIVLENLQSLGWIQDFRCSDQMVKMIPNIRKLEMINGGEADDGSCLTNLVCLGKLESLSCIFYESMSRINYPHSLKKLRLDVHESQCLEDILDKVGALPLLQKLKLNSGTFKEGEWQTTEGQFCSLKFLSLYYCKGLQVWTSEASHFPRLERLHLSRLGDLEDIPLDFADIPTLRLIKLYGCSDSAGESARRILEEQEALYGEEDTTLQVHVR